MVQAALELHSYQHQCNMYRQLQHNQQFIELQIYLRADNSANLHKNVTPYTVPHQYYDW